MDERMKYFDKIPLYVILAACLTIGLAPFNPPHLVEKLGMLFSGNLVKAIDWFDLLLHGGPWALLVLKLVLNKTSSKSN